MKTKIDQLCMVLIMSITLISCQQTDEFQENSGDEKRSKFAELKGPYLGQNPPGKTPEVFAPGIVSNGLNNFLIYFSAEGTEMVFSSGIREPHYLSMVFHSQMKGATWTEPVEIPVARGIFHRPVLNPDGTRLFMISSRAEGNTGEESSPVRIYVLDKVGTQWSAPKRIDFGEAFPYSCSQTSIAASGNLYFQAGYYIDGDEDIYVSRFENGTYVTPVRLPDTVNGPEHELHPCIAPDESYLIFDCPRPDGFGKNDLYISFRDSHGEWTQAVNMGPAVNSARDERRSSVSADGKYLFFESSILDKASQLPEQPLTLQDFQDYVASPRNGSTNLYWVDASVINTLKDF